MAGGPDGTPQAPRLVSFEGIDGAGKSTLIPLVKARLKDLDVPALFTREETDTFLGDAVRRAVSQSMDPLTILHLFLADRIQHLHELEPAFDEGILVITDRYHDSTRAYQSVALTDRFHDADTFDAWLKKITQDWLLQPARTYLLDVEVATAMKRLDSRTEQGGYEKSHFLEKVRTRYLELAKQEPHRWVVLDAREHPEELARQVIDDLQRHVLADAGGSLAGDMKR